MKIIVCVDKNNGMTFNGRRQSQDSAVRQKIAQICGNSPIYMNNYTAKTFSGECNVIIDESFLQTAGKDDFCFVENLPVDAQWADEIYLFNWNRRYPADSYFDIDLKQGYKRVSKEEFSGTSHDKITLEIFRRTDS